MAARHGYAAWTRSRRASKAWHAKYPGGIINRGYFGRGRDKSVTLSLKDQQGRARLVASVGPDGTPKIDFLDASEESSGR